MAGATAGSPVVSQNAAAAAAAAVAAAATSQAASYNSNGAGGHTGHNAAAVAAAAAAALNNPSAAAAAAALLPGNQVGAESISLFQSPAKGATIPYRPSPSNTPTCICNSNSSSNSSINSTINSNGSTTVTLSALPTVAASAAVVAASSQQQQHQIQSQQADSQYSRQLLLQLPQATQQQQQQIVSPMATQTLQISNGSNNNIPAYLGDHQQQHQSTDKMDPFVAAAMAAAAYTQPQPMIYPSMEQYIYPTSIDPFQLAGSESLKESQQLASPSSTSSSSCSNYSMMMVPPTAVPTAVGSAGQYAFYTPQTAAEVRTTTTTMWGTIAMEILVTPPTLQLNTPYPNYPCIMFCSKPSKHLSKNYCFTIPQPHFYYPNYTDYPHHTRKDFLLFSRPAQPTPTPPLAAIGQNFSCAPY